MNKIIIYLLVIVVGTSVVVGIMKYLNSTKIDESVNNTQINSSSDSKSTNTTADTYSESTHVFSGTVIKKLDDVKVGTNTLERFEVRTKSDSPSKGAVPNIVIVSNADKSIEIKPLTTFTYRFYTKYDAENKWYTVIKAEKYIID